MGLLLSTTFQDDSDLTENSIEIYSSPMVPSIIESMGKEHSSIIRLEKVIDDLDATTNEYFLNIFKSKGLEVGILRLRKGETDIQEPHSIDEGYFVIEGTGHIEIEDIMKPINPADFIFVPANVHHRFVVGNKDLIVLYFFGCS